MEAKVGSGSLRTLMPDPQGFGAILGRMDASNESIGWYARLLGLCEASSLTAMTRGGTQEEVRTCRIAEFHQPSCEKAEKEVFF